MMRRALAHGLPLARQTFAAALRGGAALRRLARLQPGTQEALDYVFERWDGNGLSAGRRRARASPLPARLLHVARDISVLPFGRGADDARAVIERRSGTAYEPRLAALAAPSTSTTSSSAWTRRGPGSRRCERAVSPASGSPATESTPLSRAIAMFTDLKSRWRRGHSAGVAELAEAAAWRLGLPPGGHASCGARRSPTTSAASASRMRSGTSPGRSGSASGSACGCIRTSPSALSPSHRRSRRSARWPARTTSGSTAPATTADPAGRRSSARPASSPPPTATRRCASQRPAPGGARRAGRRGASSCARRARGGSTRRPSTRCSPPRGTACRAPARAARRA